DEDIARRHRPGIARERVDREHRAGKPHLHLITAPRDAGEDDEVVDQQRNGEQREDVEEEIHGFPLLAASAWRRPRCLSRSWRRRDAVRIVTTIWRNCKMQAAPPASRGDGSTWPGLLDALGQPVSIDDS